MAKRQSGFTLIEILIVVIILGILAAIVIPQFSSASEDAKKGAAMTTQASVRAQLSLWKLQHNDTYPTKDQLNAGVVTPWDVMTKNTCAIPGTPTPGTGTFGPYLQSVPTNQINGLATVTATAVAAGIEPASTETEINTFGWVYDATNGRIWATTKK